MRVFWPPVTSRWNDLTKRQGLILLLAGLVLEIAIRWIVRPDIPLLKPGNPWFDLPLRLVIEFGMILFFIAAARSVGASLASVGFPKQKWTRWDWGALLVIGGTELLVVILLVGERWIRIWNEGILSEGLSWAGAEFLFGFNQETGFRGLIMAGLLPLVGIRWAVILNTLLFLIGPIHGPGLITWIGQNPGAGLGYAAGVIVHGLAFSWIRLRSDNIVLCGVLHGIINGFMNGAGFALRVNL